jgi:hypothetical protein
MKSSFLAMAALLVACGNGPGETQPDAGDPSTAGGAGGGSGRGGDSVPATRHPPEIGFVTGAKALSGGRCALLLDGTVTCWEGQFDLTYLTPPLPNGTVPRPKPIAGLTDVTAITADQGYGCALKRDGSVYCWEMGSFGRTSTTEQWTAAPIAGLAGVIAISTGVFHTCAVLAEGAVKCWGANGAGELGNGTRTDSPTPVSVQGLTSAVSVSAGYAHTCAVLSDGGVKCWGQENLGVGAPVYRSLTPVTVPTLSMVKTLSEADDHTCALLEDGSVRCWGWNNFGQLGTGRIDGLAEVPVPALVNPEMVQLTAGPLFTCAVTTGGALTCWGEYPFVPNGESPTPSSLPSATVYRTGVAAVSAGPQNCVLLTDATVDCWYYVSP